jgi:hypothetical protein
MVKQFILLFTFLLLLPLTSFAQSAGSLSLRADPPFPEVEEQYSVTSYVSGTGKTQAKQSWFLNGIEEKIFTNEEKIMLYAEDISTTITTRITFTDGTFLEKSLKITPIRIDLIVDAETGTPHFYKGARLPSSGSTFTVNALVFKNNAQLASGLSYLWSIDGKVQNPKPIKGKSSVTFVPSFEKTVVVSVEIFDGNNKIASDSLTVPIVKPEVHFYDNNPLRGLSSIALRDGHLFVGDEMTVRAEAYYLQKNFIPADNFVEWKINGRTSESSSPDKQEIVLEKKGESGKASISFDVTNLQNLLQGVKRSIMLTF